MKNRYVIARLIAHEWRLWKRDASMRWLGVTIALLGISALLLQADYCRKTAAGRNRAQQASRQAWLHQDLKHPHIAAHFGNYAYRQPSSFQVFDPGVTAYTGTSVYMEPHRQNDFLLSKMEETDTGARFGWFTPALVCQLIIPLMIVLMTFNQVSGEKAKGTYSLLLAQGVSTRQLLFGKALAVFIAFFVFITLYCILAALVSAIAEPGASPSLVPWIYLWLVYSAYYAAWSLAGIAVSAVSADGTNAISILLLAWIGMNVIVPKLAASVAEDLYPLSTNYAFKKQVAEGIDRGLDGHDSRSQRARWIEDSILKAHHTDSVQHLPFNFEGYIMQRAEEYSSMVYDQNFGKIFTTLSRQQNLQSWASLLSPYLAVRNISMAACDADMRAAIRFQQQAEQYRRSFVQQLNSDMMNHSRYGDWENYAVKAGVYESVKPFVAAPNTFGWKLQNIIRENIFLALWLLALILYILEIGKRNIPV